jgi:hypothetical protein
MGRSQVLYNQRAGRTRAAARGGGRSGDGRGNRGSGGRVVRNDQTSHHRVETQKSTVDQGEIAAADDSVREVELLQRQQQQQNTSDLEADHLLSLSSATSIYASQIPVEKQRSALETPTFLTSPGNNAAHISTTTANVQALCSRMSRSLETLPKSQILRMPDHLLSTIYGPTTSTTTKELPQSTVGLKPQWTATPLPATTTTTSIPQSLGRVAEEKSHSTKHDPRQYGRSHVLQLPSQQQRVVVPVTDLTDVTTILGDDDEDEMDTRNNNNNNKPDGVVYLGTPRAPIKVDEEDLDSWLDDVIS